MNLELIGPLTFLGFIVS
ncbi:MAG: photosystem II reaction center protein Ycf12 [Nanoarchaeota archaeon]|nr:photosystem II reaction center protein Ycf12 [Nanoarchaeota archaeon]MBU1632351.1 photosystem II reaction center protein Ycf12 [Nanoarchaeota archaeon]MBU1876007.1 photosystem II reaction center protein Ycf12 [Nanoarchaeota archaeon]